MASFARSARSSLALLQLALLVAAAVMITSSPPVAGRPVEHLHRVQAGSTACPVLPPVSRAITRPDGPIGFS
uniref:Uncharacterized protein n=1 Tax=Oryza punctata TaxID=4537 RepID=A0A0E0LD40_ORYPU